MFPSLQGHLRHKIDQETKHLCFAAFFLITSLSIIKPLMPYIFCSFTSSDDLPYAYIVFALYAPFHTLTSWAIEYYGASRLFLGLLKSSAVINGAFATIVYLAFSSDQTAVHFSMLGWSFYLFGLLISPLTLSLFWTSIHQQTRPSSAQKKYGLLIFAGHHGCIIAPLLCLICITGIPYEKIGATILLALSCCFMLLTHYYGKKAITEVPQSPLKKNNFLRGLCNLFTAGYPLAISLHLFCYYASTTMVELHLLKVLSILNQHNLLYISFWLAAKQLGVTVGGYICALINLTLPLRKKNIAYRLLALPFSIACMGGLILYVPSLPSCIIALIVVKSIYYSITYPAQEELYVPVAPHVKKITKSWIDLFIPPFSKATGATLFLYQFHLFSSISSYVLLAGVISTWSTVLVWISSQYGVLRNEKRPFYPQTTEQNSC